MVPNPAVPEPDGILSADELFSDGVLLPLDLVSLARTPAGLDQHEAPSAVAEPEARPGPIPDTATGSKRWKDIFKKNDKKSPLNEQVEDVGTRGQLPRYLSLSLCVKFLLFNFK